MRPPERAGAMTVTDWARASGRLSAPRRRWCSNGTAEVAAKAAGAAASAVVSTNGPSRVRLGEFRRPVSGPCVPAVRAGVGGRYVEGRVAVEEPGRLKVEADALDGHHRPVLRPGQVVGAEGVPNHDVGFFQRTVGGHVGGKAGATRVLIGIVAGGEALPGGIGGDPQVPGGEA